MDLYSLRKKVEVIEDPSLKQDALRDIKKLEDGIQLANNGYARIQKQYAEKLAAPRISRAQLTFIAGLCGVMAYFFARYGFWETLQAGGYTERHTGVFITATSDPISYWFALGFFGFGMMIMTFLAIGGVLALFTYPIPFLLWLKARNKHARKSKSNPN